MTKILLTGSNGQIGKCLTLQLQDKVELLAVDRAQLDITDRQAVQTQIHAFCPHIVINAAAYTAVDKAESEQALAEAVNHHATHGLAEAAADVGAAFLHISTDYVFDGTKAGEYREEDATNPQGVYGVSKARGEQAALHANPRTIVLRTAWVFGEYGHNFVKTMLRLGRERDTLGVVNDQFGGPTYAGDIATALVAISKHIADGAATDYGIYHYSGQPCVSWYEFARTIFTEALEQGLVTQTPQLNAISTQDYPTPARRPANSCLNLDKIRRTFGIAPSDWQKALKNLHPYM